MAGFGIPNRRRRVFLVAAMYADARDVLLTQGVRPCLGACSDAFEGRPCYRCHDPKPSQTGHTYSYALDMGNARWAAPHNPPHPKIVLSSTGFDNLPRVPMHGGTWIEPRFLLSPQP